jgi:hypothetical protein
MEQFWDLVEYNAFAVQFRYETFETSEPLTRSNVIAKVEMLFNHVKQIIENIGATK